ncbi:MAG TPA: hypothetical protein VM533_18285 [Fimbriiglobus sp.]|jgi:hypothetical protein|nr:hypothetical protein [Fimbriiglobus sp.]
MRREDVIETIQKLTPEDRSKLMIVLRNGIGINVEILFRAEPEYLVVRGREMGSTDDNRAFFVPYEEVAYLKLERSVKLTDLQRMYGGPSDSVFAEPDARSALAVTPAPVEVAPAPAVDPAVIARQNLLERLRAARTSAGTRG